MFADSDSREDIDKSLQTKYRAVGEDAYLRTSAGMGYEMKQRIKFGPLAKILLQKYGNHLLVADR